MNTSKINAEISQAIIEARHRSIGLLSESELIKMGIKLRKIRLKEIKKELKQRTKELKRLKKLGF